MNRMVAARADQTADRGAWITSRGESDRAFRAARRHSRLVRRLRVAVPGAAVVTLAAVVAWAWYDPLAKLPLQVGNVMVSGSKITMQSPRLTGFSNDARPYELSAKFASQDVTKPDLIELHELQARIQLPQDATAQMTALDGTYDSKNEILTLGKNVVLTSSTGYKVWLTDAVIDIRKTHVVSEKPVRVEMLQGTLDARRVEVAEAGALLLFDGGVKMQLTLDSLDLPAPGGQAAPAAAPAAPRR